MLKPQTFCGRGPRRRSLGFFEAPLRRDEAAQSSSQGSLRVQDVGFNIGFL